MRPKESDWRAMTKMGDRTLFKCLGCDKACVLLVSFIPMGCQEHLNKHVVKTGGTSEESKVQGSP